MIRRWRRIRNSKADHQPRARTKIVLAGIATEGGAGEVSHKVIQLCDTPSKVLLENHIDAAAHGYGKAVLGPDANHRGVAMRPTQEELGKRNKVIKLAPIQAWTKQITDDRSVNGDSTKVPILEAVSPQLHRQAKCPRGVIGEGAAGTMVVKICKRTARTEVNVVIHCGSFVARHKLSGSTRVIRGSLRLGRLRLGEWLWARSRGKREDVSGENTLTARHGVARSPGGFLCGGGGTARGIVRGSGGFFLRAERRRQKNAQCCC